jgi:hypothetical protein
MRTYSRIPAERRFWRFVSPCPNSGCWHWTGGTTPFGHGRFRLSREDGQIGPHVFSYRLHVAPVPAGSCVLHHCDNPGCVNPDHLYVGDKGDNARDAVTRSRMKTLFATGADARRGTGRTRKLSDSDIREIRSSTGRAEQLAVRYGVSVGTIRNARSGRTWGNV